MAKASSLLPGLSAPEAFDGFLSLSPVGLLPGFGVADSGALVMVLLTPLELVMVELALLRLVMVELSLLGLAMVELVMVELITQTEGSVMLLLPSDLEVMTVTVMLIIMTIGILMNHHEGKSDWDHSEDDDEDLDQTSGHQT